MSNAAPIRLTRVEAGLAPASTYSGSFSSALLLYTNPDASSESPPAEDSCAPRWATAPLSKVAGYSRSGLLD